MNLCTGPRNLVFSYINHRRKRKIIEVILFNMQRVDDAVRLACEGLAKEITQHKDSGEARKFAVWLASICKNSIRTVRRNTLDALPNLYLLLDLSTFFQFYHDKK